MSDSQESRNAAPATSGEDARIVELLRSQLDPGEPTPAARAAFRARLEERIEARAARPGRSLVLAASTALVAAALVLGLPSLRGGEEGAAPGTRPAGSASLLAYAYYETDYLAETEVAATDFLSDEYRALATAFELP